MTVSNLGSWRRSAAALLVGSALFAFAPAAAADPASQPTAQEKEHARDLMADGRDKRDRNDLAGALESFKQADAIMHVPTTAYEVAKTQQQLGKLVDARETVDALSKLPSSPSDPAPFMEARGKADVLAKELDKQLGRVKVEAGATSLTVDGAPATAHDGVLWVMPGKRALASGDARLEITIAAGETKTFDAQTQPKPYGGPEQPPPSSSGGLKIPTLSLIGFGVGAAGLIVGSVTGVMAMSAEGDLADECPNMKCKSANKDDLDSAKTKATISTVGFIVAGVGIAVGVVGFFLQPKTEAKVGSIKLDFSRMRATF